jgi:integrase
MKIRFYLRKSTKNYSINFEFRSSNGNIRLRTSTGFIVQNSKQWDSKKERLKLPSSILSAADINLKLSESIYKFNKSISNMEEESFSELMIQNLMNEAFGKKIEKEVQVSSKKNLIEYYEWFLEYYSINNSPYTKKTLTKGTLTTYKSALTRLKNYIEDRKLKRFSFNDCNREFYNDYVSFLTSKNYSLNYVGTMIQKLKTIIGFAFDEGIHNNTEFRKNYFSKMTEQIDHVYLTIEELQRIKELSISDVLLDSVRDVFLIGCYTGLRISDTMSLLKRANQSIFIDDGVKYFHIKQIKTSNTVIIPLNRIINEILDKRDGNLPDYLHQKIVTVFVSILCHLCPFVSTTKKNKNK